jgi:DNA-binding CsgD family transcriptional regulator
MRDSSSKGARSNIVDAGLGDRPTCLARFTLDERSFELVVCHNKHIQQAPEVVRFDLNGSTVAIVEDVAPVEVQDFIARLTGRELQIAALVAEGDATKNIAHKLCISEWTVVTHLRRIFAKLNVDNRAAMVYLCASLIKSAAKPGNSDKAEAGKTSHPIATRERRKRARSFAKA